MNISFHSFILEKLQAKEITKIEVVQKLWSGYGSIIRYKVIDGICDTVIIKHVQPPLIDNHPRGWNTNLSNSRKINSYLVESEWYKSYATKTNLNCSIPKCFGVQKSGNEVCMILEDLDAIGYDQRKTIVDSKDVKACIHWLANFHANFMNVAPINLWKIGTYWHLDTRPEELKALEDLPLKNAASKIDSILNQSPFQTLVHGDSKLANFCFSKTGKVAAVDFQYVGGGVGVKDLAYFIGSCYLEEDCESNEEDLLAFYFKQLKLALLNRNVNLDFKALEQNWRDLYSIAWTDFHRFLKGWSPGHWKIHSYSEKMKNEVLAKLEYY